MVTSQQSQKEQARARVIKELIFDMSASETGARLRAMRNLVEYADCDVVMQAARQCYNHESDPACRHALNELLNIGEAIIDPSRIRLVGRPDNLPEPMEQKPAIPKVSPTLAGKMDFLSKDSGGIPVNTTITADSPANPEICGNSAETEDQQPPPEIQQDIQAPLLPPEGVLNMRVLTDFAGAATLYLKKLENAYSLNVSLSKNGMHLLVAAAFLITAILCYTIFSGATSSVAPGNMAVKPVASIVAIQTEELPPGTLVTGTLKSYEIFAQMWFFLSDDNRLYRLKLDKSPGFYKTDARIRIRVESCTRNALGHVVLIAKSEETL